MLAKKFRIRGQKKFTDIYQKGNYFFTRFFNLRYLKNSKDQPRFAIVISAKTSKKAPLRNRVKRQLLEIIRKNLANFDKNYDYLITVKKPWVEKPSSEKEKDLITALKRTKLWII